MRGAWQHSVVTQGLVQVMRYSVGRMQATAAPACVKTLRMGGRTTLSSNDGSDFRRVVVVRPRRTLPNQARCGSSSSARVITGEKGWRMSVAEVPGHESAGERLRDLLRRCGATSDHAERASLLTQVARGLDDAARELAEAGHPQDTSEMVAVLHGQAVMARFMAELERGGWARHLDRS
jgi:hypothetical protein